MEIVQLPMNQECLSALVKPVPVAADDRRLWFMFAAPRPEQGDVGDPQLTLNGKPLLTLRSSSVMVNSLWRATQTRNRLLRLAYDKFPPAQVTLARRGPFWKVLAGNVAVELLTEEDARHAGKPFDSLAQDWQKSVQTILRVLETAPSKKQQVHCTSPMGITGAWKNGLACLFSPRQFCFF